MSAEQDVKDALFASAALLALVGLDGLGNVKIYPDEIPEGEAVPAVVYERPDSQPEYTLDGALAVTRVSISITCWAKTRTAANAIALEVVGAMYAAGLSPTPNKGGDQTAGGSVYEPELDEYGAVRVFDVWEL